MWIYLLVHGLYYEDRGSYKITKGQRFKKYVKVKLFKSSIYIASVFRKSSQFFYSFIGFIYSSGKELCCQDWKSKVPTHNTFGLSEILTQVSRVFALQLLKPIRRFDYWALVPAKHFIWIRARIRLAHWAFIPAHISYSQKLY